MSLFCVKTQDLSWQDRTINVEVMMAPARSQLLYNKHKALKTKCQQESYNMDREKYSYVKSFKTEQRMMERRKEMYCKLRHDINLRKASGDPRNRGGGVLEAGRASAPPRLEDNLERDNTFLTQIKTRDSKSANARTTFDVQHVTQTPSQQRQRPATTTTHHAAPPATQNVMLGAISSGFSTRTPTPGRPFLERNRSVRFNNSQLDEETDEQEPAPPPELSMEEKIQIFLNEQDEFNKRKISSASGRDNEPTIDKKLLLARRYSTLQVNMNKLESAFDEFCTSNNSSDGLQKLVKFATKMKAHVRTARNASIVPSVASAKGSRAFKGLVSRKETSLQV